MADWRAPRRDARATVEGTRRCSLDRRARPDADRSAFENPALRFADRRGACEGRRRVRGDLPRCRLDGLQGGRRRRQLLHRAVRAAGGVGRRRRRRVARPVQARGQLRRAGSHPGRAAPGGRPGRGSQPPPRREARRLRELLRLQPEDAGLPGGHPARAAHGHDRPSPVVPSARGGRAGRVREPPGGADLRTAGGRDRLRRRPRRRTVLRAQRRARGAERQRGAARLHGSAELFRGTGPTARSTPRRHDSCGVADPCAGAAPRALRALFPGQPARHGVLRGDPRQPSDPDARADSAVQLPDPRRAGDRVGPLQRSDLRTRRRRLRGGRGGRRLLRRQQRQAGGLGRQEGARAARYDRTVRVLRRGVVDPR